jgi:hypothetical protein
MSSIGGPFTSTERLGVAWTKEVFCNCMKLLARRRVT